VALVRSSAGWRRRYRPRPTVADPGSPPAGAGCEQHQAHRHPTHRV